MDDTRGTCRDRVHLYNIFHTATVAAQEGDSREVELQMTNLSSILTSWAESVQRTWCSGHYEWGDRA
jgi:hypothetical protein